MGALTDAIADKTRRRAVCDDGVRAIEAEVKSKRGLTGVAVKAGFRAVRSVRPGFVPMAMDHLLNDFAAQIDPFYDQWKDGGKGTLRDYFIANDAKIANALLSITDNRAKNAKSRTVAKAYSKLRPKAVSHTAAAMPRVADLVAKHVG
jgi:hypothetical protein